MAAAKGSGGPRSSCLVALVSLCKDDQVLELDGGEGVTTRMALIPLNCTHLW